ncbi:MAG TPA: T9SS type A sorting domain-containing protein [Saprospiraceae bacterium]|nr:T9SS type A sorting domain-containing protein [Lewinellaceae bacterium]HPQ20631.1 T9SS type A sorting domain-containing protein [Saprospiraceae bacterium]
MKNLIYIFILLLSSQNISTQTDTTSLSFVSERNTWYVTSSSISSPDVYTNIFTFSDTDSLVFNVDINDFRRYRELLIINDEDKPIHTKILFREEGRQVYTWALPSDEIAYDFSLNVGDTIRYSIGFIDYIVESKDSTELQDGSNRAVLKMEYCDSNLGWIQGIGSLEDPFEPWYSCAIDYGVYLSCFFRDGVQLYKSPWYDECFTVGTDDVNLNKISLFPNPASYTMTISGLPDGKYTYRIQNTQGQQMLSNTFQNKDSIDVSDLPSGMYFVELRNGDGQRWIEKFVVGR